MNPDFCIRGTKTFMCAFITKIRVRHQNPRWRGQQPVRMFALRFITFCFLHFKCMGGGLERVVIAYCFYVIAFDKTAVNWCTKKKLLLTLQYLLDIGNAIEIMVTSARPCWRRRVTYGITPIGVKRPPRSLIWRNKRTFDSARYLCDFWIFDICSNSCSILSGYPPIRFGWIYAQFLVIFRAILLRQLFSLVTWKCRLC